MRNPFQKMQLRPLCRAVAVVSSMGVAGYSSAAVLEEITVTAQKREQNLQDVGISVSAFSGEQMDALGVTNTTEIIQQIPGLQVSEFSPNLTTFNIRGVSQANFQDHLEAPVAVFVDDVYVASMNAISGQLFDVERVEVLRGPQGTLFGRNATGGLIHYFSRPADEDELNGYVEVGYGNYNSKHIEMAIGGALSDTVRGRFSARTEKADGYIEATEPGVEDIHSKDNLALRGTLQVDFSDDLTGDFFLKYSKADLDTGAYINTGELITSGPNAGFFVVNSQDQSLPGSNFDPYKFSSGTRGFLERENISASAKFNWDMNEDVNVVSITGYHSMDKNYLEDGDGSAQGLAIDFNPDTTFTQFTQEIRFSGDTDSIRWQAGLFYMDAETETDTSFTGGPLINLIGITFPPGPPTFGGGIDPYGIGLPVNNPTAYSPNLTLLESSVVESKNWSIFGQAEFDLSDELTLIVGLRWSEDEKEIDYDSGWVDQGVPLLDPSWLGLFVNAPIPYLGVDGAGTSIGALNGISRNNDIDYEDWAGRVQLDWRVTDETLLFASWNRGIKGGNWNASLVPYISVVDPSVPFQHPEEVLNSYELGIKTELNNWARLNATIFYYDYEDYQGFSVAGLVPQIQSSDATNQGGEIELFLTPGEHWDIVLGLSLLDSEVDEVSGSGFLFSDVEFPQAPEWSFNYLFRYNWDALGGNIALQLDGVYEDDHFLEIQNGPASLQEKSGIANARASYTTDDGSWEISAWIKNIEDKARKVYSLDLGANGGSTAQFGSPQTFGLTVKRNFGAF